MRNFLIRIGFTFLLLGGMLGFFGGQDMLISFSTPIDIYENPPADYSKVKAVETQLDMLLDIFCEEETVTKKNGAITGRRYDYYYIVPVFVENDEETYYVGVKVSSEKCKPYDAVVDATLAYLNYETDSFDADPVKFQGGFHKMEDKMYGYFKDWFEEYKFFENEEDADKYLLPLVLETVSYSSVRIACYVMIGLIILGIIMLFFGFRPAKQQDANPAAVSSVVSIDGINYPASNFVKVNALIQKGKTDKAIAQLQKVINIDSSTATYIVNNWNQYWN